ncbi:MAG: MotA/TolQ/ExbB proton channel family protein, partial [Burkholderiaceae bacterium]|nr:MotA/TolQ/ExbB proton channel family protein [Burkholderiaceae bacterium]
MESQFGLYNVWAQGDWVTRGVALLLLGMSLATWMVILFKAMDLVRFKKLARQAETFWHSADLAEGLNRLGPPEDNPFRALAEEGREAVAHHRNTK